MLQCLKRHPNFMTMKTLKSVQNYTEFFMEVQTVMDCPRESNFTKQELYRMELRFCCNASQRLFLTQENTRVGQRITYEAERAFTKTVDQEVFHMLPKTAPWWTESNLQRCAVVGNGGILRNSSCGDEIDSADFIIRLNLPPMNYSSDIGVMTHLVTINPSQITNSFRGLKYSRKSFVKQAASYGRAALMTAAFSYTANTDIAFRVLHTMRDMRPQQEVLFINPDYLFNLDRFWRQKGHAAIRLSSGFMLVNTALELCQKVDLYGFWPFSVTPQQQSLLHHYYDNVGPVKGVHQMTEEFLRLLQMHNEGVLQVHVGECH
ncbi:alpha-2,8-sialyltransferase 8E-like [Megalops cyprinoides]|uniref:alpha-2,8-sialyltransferase 8E-like n=1 Tax=Megalops cyprinoides TaxID=118141 RepID=UPI001863E0EB|nr:alpha-2,8-sialyltransferase 8E-like [Megalops cyprinoides]